MNFNTLLVSTENYITTINLNRPDKLNALNAELLLELQQALTQLAQDSQTRALIITGSGVKSFAAGADIEELHTCDTDSGFEFARRGQKVFDMIENFPVPVIAAVNGFALGGGCELAMSCHFRYAATNAKFGQPEVKLGIIPGYGGTQRLTRHCGVAHATEIICSGIMIDAERAQQIGLVSTVVPQEELMTSCIEIASKITAMAPLAVTASLNAIRAQFMPTNDECMIAEAREFARICGTQDFKEGTLAFLEKRAANFVAA